MNKTAQIYGYVVCAIAVIAFLIAISGLVSAIIDLGNPLYAGFRNDDRLASFENFKVHAMQSIDKEAAYIPTDDELRSMYESAKSEMIAVNTYRSKRDILVTSIVIVVCIILFSTHWIWMRKLRRRQEMAMTDS